MMDAVEKYLADLHVLESLIVKEAVWSYYIMVEQPWEIIVGAVFCETKTSYRFAFKSGFWNYFLYLYLETL
jgi:hypothetical protein